MIAKYFVLAETGFDSVKVGEDASMGNFRFVPYVGDLKIKVNADKLRIKSGHDTNSEVVREQIQVKNIHHMKDI